MDDGTTNKVHHVAPTSEVIPEKPTLGENVQLEAEECCRRMYSLFETFIAVCLQERTPVGLWDCSDTAEGPCTNKASRPTMQHHQNLSIGILAQLQKTLASSAAFTVQASVKRETAGLRTELAATGRTLHEALDAARNRISCPEASLQRLSSENLHASAPWSNANTTTEHKKNTMTQHSTLPDSTYSSTTTMNPALSTLALSNLQHSATELELQSAMPAMTGKSLPMAESGVEAGHMDLVDVLKLATKESQEHLDAASAFWASTTLTPTSLSKRILSSSLRRVFRV
mmetsp:Transcript_111990/g.217001  ORF Transcript_111990/g.217001 Transcript_111990/m.217001 type:complete len:286 (+) Transcript_111990:74-931(+)